MTINNNSSDDEKAGLCPSEVFYSSNDIAESENEIMKSKKFFKLVEQLNLTTFSDDSNLIKIRDMINDINLTNSQWKKITLLLINWFILNKNSSSGSEPSVVKEKHKTPGMTLCANDINDSQYRKRNVKHKNLRRQKRIDDIDLDLNLIDDNYLEGTNQKGGALWDTGEEQLVPFEIGMKILEGKIDSNDQDIGEETKQKIKKIEDDACKMAAKRMNRSPEYQRLFHEKEHWKYLAKTRLIELENEIDFRYELVFGDNKKKFL